ncbi:ferredoxin-like protein [Alkaliphilus transvaalensis]|uniref:ferredoxin-like protein n=1 Tax=Alkaliphilus transvaalensis TaxID=114628 RepID=UPI0006861896|nr:ferredoxin-like protein [Alkaliphilus transvaalensis]
MSHEEKMGFWEKTSNRREFLKFSGKTVAGVTVSATLLSLLTGCQDTASVSGFPLATGLLISDSTRCSGCRRCETICTMNNDGKADPNIARVKVGRNYNFGPGGPKNDFHNKAGNYGNLEIIPDTCQQCKDPVPCAEACPMEAIYAEEKTGTRVVDTEKCVGCGMCASQCPFKMITVDEDEKKAKKCFLCDGDPSCAKMCPTAALKLVPWKEVHATIQKNKHLFA